MLTAELVLVALMAFLLVLPSRTLALGGIKLLLPVLLVPFYLFTKDPALVRNAFPYLGAISGALLRRGARRARVLRPPPLARQPRVDRSPPG